jgi:hypothetical protein
MLPSAIAAPMTQKPMASGRSLRLRPDISVADGQRQQRRADVTESCPGQRDLRVRRGVHRGEASEPRGGDERQDEEAAAGGGGVAAHQHTKSEEEDRRRGERGRDRQGMGLVRRTGQQIRKIGHFSALWTLPGAMVARSKRRRVREVTPRQAFAEV